MNARTAGAIALCGTLLLTPAHAAAQTPATPVFEVASIKAAVPLQTQISTGQLRIQQTITDTRLDLNSVALADLVVMAYRIKPYQLTAPDWMRSERYDVQATYPAGATKEQVPEMLRALLADRFKLKVHHDNKPQPTYALLVGKDGHKLKPAGELPPEPPPDPNARTTTVAGQDIRMSSDGRGGQVVTAAGQAMRISSNDGVMRVELSKATLAQYADLIGQFLDKPVIDQTGLTGNYQIPFEFSQDDMMAMVTARAAAAGVSLPGLPGVTSTPGQAPAPSSGSSVFTAVQKLGLKLEPRNLPVEIIIVDSANKTPTEN